MTAQTLGRATTYTALLLSGGLDSAALAAWTRPTVTLFVDYGQRPASAERRASAAIARELHLPHEELRIDAGAVGGGLLSNDGEPLAGSPSPEWWPFRNQLLVTLAAAWVVRSACVGATPSGVLSADSTSTWTVITGSVREDGVRHRDGTQEFYKAMDGLLSIQEGSIRAQAPALKLTTVELIGASSVTDEVLGWTHSCQTSNHPCLECPGCWKRESVLRDLGRLQ